VKPIFLIFLGKKADFSKIKTVVLEKEDDFFEKRDVFYFKNRPLLRLGV